jgi:hypothetical protein
MNRRTRSNNFHLRLTDEEFSDLHAKAGKVGIGPQAYIHAVLKGHQLKEKPSMDLTKVLRNLSQINNNMNQIAMKAHTLNFVDTAAYWENANALEATIRELLEFMYGG